MIIVATCTIWQGCPFTHVPSLKSLNSSFSSLFSPDQRFAPITIKYCCKPSEHTPRGPCDVGFVVDNPPACTPPPTEGYLSGTAATTWGLQIFTYWKLVVKAPAAVGSMTEMNAVCAAAGKSPPNVMYAGDVGERERERDSHFFTYFNLISFPPPVCVSPSRPRVHRP